MPASLASVSGAKPVQPEMPIATLVCASAGAASTVAPSTAATFTQRFHGLFSWKKAELLRCEHAAQFPSQFRRKCREMRRVARFQRSVVIPCGSTNGTPAGGVRETARRDLEHPRQQVVGHGLGRRAVGRDASAVEHHDAIGRQRREVEVVQDRHHGDAAPRAASDRFQHVELMLQVEARGRLVEQQQARPVRGLAAGKLHQHAGEMRALLLAAGERRDDALAERREIDVGERALGKLVDRAAVAVARTHAHDFADRERKRHMGALRQHRAMQREIARRVAPERAAFQRNRCRRAV